MTLLAFLNELSFPSGNIEDHDRRAAIGTLIGTLKSLRNVQSNVALHSSVPLQEVPLGDGAWLAPFLASAGLRDEWRFLRGFENRAPFRVGLGDSFGLEAEYHYEGQAAEGLGLSHALGTFALSFAQVPWAEPNVKLTRVYLNDGAECEEELVEVRHASTTDHIGVHDEWLRVFPLARVSNGDELWEMRGELFPRLKFRQQVEAQIRGLQAGDPILRSAGNALMELELALVAWNVENDPLPTFRTKVTPEHENRRQKFLLTDLSGIERYFDMHSRFTPGAGRVHFWCDRSNGTAIVAHVGNKIPD